MCFKPVGVGGYLVKCRKCPACVVQRKNEWIFRLTEEQKDHKLGYFMTFTYSQENIPNIDLTTGELGRGHNPHSIQSLRRKDVINYFKKVRNAGNKPRYYYVGEYGEETKRPHYHAIVFGVSEVELERHWKHGFTYSGEVNKKTIRYVVKYMTKRIKNTPEHAEFPRSIMSKGIGRTFLKYKDFIRKNEQLVWVNQKFTEKIPNYYLERIYEPEQLKILREKYIDGVKNKQKIIMDSCDTDQDRNNENAKQMEEEYNRYNAMNKYLEKISKSIKI